MTGRERLDPFVDRMKRFHAESEVFNATPGDATYEDMPDFSLCNDLRSGAVKIESVAGVALAVRYVVDDDCIGDTTAEQVLKAALAFLEAAPSICAVSASDPELAEMIAYWRNRDGQMVPVAEGGMCVRLVSHHRIGDVALPDPLPVADYITGLELLGFRFEVYGPADARRWGTAMPDPPLPAPWEAHALRLEAAMDRLAHRAEIIAFLLGRAGGAGGAP